ncbi:hypothetical protein [Roseovarius sp. 2305UL8-3]|uniref:hypothetical protein n=1 Tax=Roseovarius conchicola TaxID=3121636 RepID=UPI0035272E1D
MANNNFGGSSFSMYRPFDVPPKINDAGLWRQDVEATADIKVMQREISVNREETENVERRMDAKTNPISEERGEGKAICRLIDPTTREIVGWLYLWESGRTMPRFIGEVPTSNFVEVPCELAARDLQFSEASPPPKSVSGSSSKRNIARKLRD